MSKKESFIKGTLILAAAALVARLLGLVQRVPLEHLLGPVGDASFGVANSVYLMLLTVATAGIPSTLSKMVSERYALDKPQDAKRVYQAALIFAAFAGIVMTILLWSLAPFYATYIAQVPEASTAIRALAPALLLFPTIAMMRGYFQGRNNMAAGGISQIVEQFARVGTAILLAFILLRLGYADEEVAAGASFGGVLGSIGAFAVMMYFAFKQSRKDQSMGLALHANTQVPLSRIYRDIFTLSIPIVLSSLAVPVVNFIDSSIIKPLISGDVGSDAATNLLGILTNRAQPVAGIPPILAIALSQSLIPIIAAAYARKDESHLRGQVTLAMRIAIMTGMPMVIALTVAAYSINGLLFSTLEGAGVVAMLTFGTIFQITMMTSNSILLGIGKPKLTMVTVFIGIVVKLAASFALAPFFGIYGIIASTGLAFLIITVLNVRVLKKTVSFSILGKRWAGFAATVVLSAGIGYGLHQLGLPMAELMPSRLAYLINCGIVGLAVLISYFALLILLGVLREDELKSYPRIVQKVLRPLMRLKRSGNQRARG